MDWNGSSVLHRTGGMVGSLAGYHNPVLLSKKIAVIGSIREVKGILEKKSLRENILRFAAEQYGTEAEHLWTRYPNYVVLRHQNKKWYAIIMDVSREKLGLPGEGFIDVIDIKTEPLLAGSLRLERGILPAYHMNKGNWITVLLDGTVAEKQIMTLLDMSYQITGRTKSTGKSKKRNL